MRHGGRGRACCCRRRIVRCLASVGPVCLRYSYLCPFMNRRLPLMFCLCFSFSQFCFLLIVFPLKLSRTHFISHLFILLFLASLSLLFSFSLLLSLSLCLSHSPTPSRVVHLMPQTNGRRWPARDSTTNDIAAVML